jgi:hypothetical protein
MITSVSIRSSCHLEDSLTITQTWCLKMSPNCMLVRECIRDDDADMSCSDYSGGQTKLKKILLNGNNICMVRPLYKLEGLDVNFNS